MMPFLGDGVGLDEGGRVGGALDASGALFSCRNPIPRPTPRAIMRSSTPVAIAIRINLVFKAFFFATAASDDRSSGYKPLGLGATCRPSLP